MKRIAILGGGGTGHAAAADLALAGHEVNIYEQPEFNKGNIESISERGGITIKGPVREGFAKINKVTEEIEDALEDVSIIIVACRVLRQEKFAELCAPFLTDGQTILISPGNAGSILFANKLKELGVRKKLIIAETEGNLYSCRLVAPAEVMVALTPPVKRVAAFPGKDTGKVVEHLSGVYDALPATNLLEATLNSPNLVGHLSGSLLNTGAIERSEGKYYLYWEGLTPSVIRCIEAMHVEKLRLLEVLGYADRFQVEMMSKLANAKEFPELNVFRDLVGPTSMQHRYISEDASTGVSLMISLGEMLDVPTPLAKALVTLASAINGVDYLKEGRTVKKLGLSGLTVDELNRFLQEGKS